MFNRILIANRGAIAVRAIETLRKLNIASVAVYSLADEDSLHVALADEAVYLGDGSCRQTYLDAELIIAAAKKTGAEAIFPGYGFLSENAAFARRCANAGLVFIGPSPEHIESFGLKHIARRLAKEAGVPLLPGSELLANLEEAKQAACDIGFPVILKSTAGGGGIGITVCSTASELAQAFSAARHLAQANFNNAGIYLEKYISEARHIEVQIFGTEDKIIVLGERDCSLQRRNQKVVEECPAPGISPEVRMAMFSAARNLAELCKYRNAGTVEFLYDNSDFYFLEVNTRLQVEHGITEECTGADLVEWMIREASGQRIEAAADIWTCARGHAIEARVYAEDCANGFLPATGKIDDAVFDSRARVHTWIRRGVEVTTLYDPMLAKLIVHAPTRTDAISLMNDVLRKTRIYGITTNLPYIEAIFSLDAYCSGNLKTDMLASFNPEEQTIEVLDGGIQTTVQDYPGRLGHWAVGVPPSGPMDDFHARLGNAILGNTADAACLELTMQGGSYRFRGEVRFCITGANMQASLNGNAVPQNIALRARKGDLLELGVASQGMRTYLCFDGGLDVACVLGSRATFIGGNFGGHGGRVLRCGDVLRIGAATAKEKPGKPDIPSKPSEPSEPSEPNKPSEPDKPDPKHYAGYTEFPQEGEPWEIGVIIGPLSTGEFLKPEYFWTLTNSTYTVGYDSARTGVRLNGPAPAWSREDGGEAGLHPSNIHDNPYSFCALDLTGDQPVLLGPDGPSLGGFVCPVVVAISERWKLGQLRPGDHVRFRIISLSEAAKRREAIAAKLQDILMFGFQAITEKDALTSQQATQLQAGQSPALSFPAPNLTALNSPAQSSPALNLPVLGKQQPYSPDQAILYTDGNHEDSLTLRQSGEDCVLVEVGSMSLDIRSRFRIHILMQELQNLDLPLLDLTPGVRSLQLHFDPNRITTNEIADIILAKNTSLPPLEDVTVPSRTVYLPLAWDDPAALLAARRYQQTTRPDAPWCPSNTEFIRRINGLNSIDDVKRIVFEASYLVLGLGDVYLGAPVATPIDPRHRLVTTKYNPARPWTPENAVGIGGSYLCVYGMEGPGGYQLVGRTVQMWNPLQPTQVFRPGRPWLLDFFDQLRFYPVQAEELSQMRKDCLRDRFNVRIEQGSFSLAGYQNFLRENEASILAFKRHQEAAFLAERQRWTKAGLDVFTPKAALPAATEENLIPEGCVPVRAALAGSVWSCEISQNSEVQAGQQIIVLESMKMEFSVLAPQGGRIERLLAKTGELVSCGQILAIIRPNN